MTFFKQKQSNICVWLIFSFFLQMPFHLNVLILNRKLNESKLCFIVKETNLTFQIIDCNFSVSLSLCLSVSLSLCLSVSVSLSLFVPLSI
jgi:hypothetical protein